MMPLQSRYKCIRSITIRFHLFLSSTSSVIRVFGIRRVIVPATRDIPGLSRIPSRQKLACVRCIRTSDGMRPAAISRREQDARADRPIMRELFELSTGRRSAVRSLRKTGVSIPSAGKCRREGCVSKRHFAAPGVARRIGGGGIIARTEPRE